MARTNVITVEIPVGMYELPRLAVLCEKENADIAEVLSFILAERVDATFAGCFGDGK